MGENRRRPTGKTQKRRFSPKGGWRRRRVLESQESKDLEFRRVCFDQDQFPVLGQYNQAAIGVQEGRPGKIRLAPGDLARLPFDAPQFGVFGVAAARSVNLSRMMDRRVPVGL